MFGIIRSVVRVVWSAVIRAKNLAAENVALRHQLDVVLRPTRSRPRLKLKLRDRILLVWVSRIWSGWKDAIRIVQPETVIGWHRCGWGLYWTWRSKSRGPDGIIWMRGRVATSRRAGCGVRERWSGAVRSRQRTGVLRGSGNPRRRRARCRDDRSGRPGIRRLAR